MQQERFHRLEEALQRVQGIRSARVMGDEVPSEIHVVASTARSPKQIVRDVQSLATAAFSMPIDHRIVSVVQLEDEQQSTDGPGDAPEETPEEETSAPSGGRPVVERVVQATKGDGGWVKVALKWPDGRITEGAGRSGGSREMRAKGAAQALLQALGPALESMGARVDVENMVIHRLGSVDSILVKATLHQKGSSAELVGSALLSDDTATAAVRALLHAINRKLQAFS